MEILKMKNPHQETLKLLSDARHDMINHLQVIHSYAKLNKTEKIYGYIESIARDYQKISRLSRLGNDRLVANLIAMGIKFPELKFDFYGQDKITLSEYIGLSEENTIHVIISTIIALAAQEKMANEIEIVITIDELVVGERSKITFSLYSTRLEEQLRAITCLKNRLAPYHVEFNQIHQDDEVFEWELVFNKLVTEVKECL